MPETILNKLRREHQELDALLIEISDAETTKLRKDLFERFKDEMIPHMEGEELTIYVKLKEMADQRINQMVDESNREHHQMKELIQKLNFLNIDSADWFKTFLDLKNLCDIHVEHEENRIFAEAKEDFSPDELVQFGQEFEQTKYHHIH